MDVLAFKKPKSLEERQIEDTINAAVGLAEYFHSDIIEFINKHDTRGLKALQVVLADLVAKIILTAEASETKGVNTEEFMKKLHTSYNRRLDEVVKNEEKDL